MFFGISHIYINRNKNRYFCLLETTKALVGDKSTDTGRGSLALVLAVLCCVVLKLVVFHKKHFLVAAGISLMKKFCIIILILKELLRVNEVSKW